MNWRYHIRFANHNWALIFHSHSSPASCVPWRRWPCVRWPQCGARRDTPPRPVWRTPAAAQSTPTGTYTAPFGPGQAETTVRRLLTIVLQNFFLRNLKIYLYCLSFLKSEMAQVVEILLHGRRRIHLSCTFNTKVADDLAMQKARSSAAMVLTLPSQNIPFPAVAGLIHWSCWYTTGMIMMTYISCAKPCHQCAQIAGLRFNIW